MSPFVFGLDVLLGTFGLFQGLRGVITGEIGDSLIGAILIGATSSSIYGGLT